MIRPSLKVNGREADLKLIKNCKVQLTINDYKTEQVISREYTDLKLSNDQETIITFQVPSVISKLNLVMKS